MNRIRKFSNTLVVCVFLAIFMFNSFRSKGLNVSHFFACAEVSWSYDFTLKEPWRRNWIDASKMELGFSDKNNDWLRQISQIIHIIMKKGQSKCVKHQSQYWGGGNHSGYCVACACISVDQKTDKHWHVLSKLVHLTSLFS